MNTYLEGKEWLVGTGVTVADIGIFNTIYYFVGCTLNDKERAKLPNVVAWFERIAQLKSFKAWWGVLRFFPNGQKFAKTVTSAAPAKKAPKKKAAKPAQVKKAPKKPKTVFPASKNTPNLTPR